MKLSVAAALILAFGVLPQVAPPRHYSAGVHLEETSETSANVSVGDLDGDGDLDLVLAKGRHWPLVNRVLLNDGRAAFTTSDLAPTWALTASNCASNSSSGTPSATLPNNCTKRR